MNAAEDDGYGYYWWIDSFSGFSAHGHGGQYIFVLPELDMIVGVHRRSGRPGLPGPAPVASDVSPARRPVRRGLKLLAAACSQSSQRTRTRCRIPGSGMDAASASTASRSAGESRRHDSIVTSVCERLHVPTISPSTRTAPGQTRGVQSWRRWSESGTRSSRSAPCRRKYASPLGRSRADAAGPPGARNVGSSLVRIHASPTGVRTGVSDPPSASNAARPAAAA